MSDITRELAAYHRTYPLRMGMPREELKSRIRVESRYFGPLLDRVAERGIIVAAPTVVRLPAHEVALSSDQQSAVQGALAAFRTNPYAPPTLAQAEEMLGAEVLQVLIDEGRLVKVSEDVLFAADAYERMEQRLVDHLREHQQVTVAEVRDLFNTSRRYALSLLEHTDRRRVTKRLGDVRVLR